MTVDVVVVNRRHPLLPRISRATEPFWNALEQGEWVLQRCPDCGTWRFPPSGLACDSCAGPLSWQLAPTRGQLYARTTIHGAPPPFSAQVPYVVGLVDFADQIRLICPLIEAENPIKIDSMVEIVALQYDDGFAFAARSS